MPLSLLLLQVQSGADWGERLAASVSNALSTVLAAIPAILAFLVILLIGWIVAWLLAKAVGGVLRRVQFNDLARRSGISDFIQSMGVNTDASGFVAAIVKWFVRLIALVVAFDALGLPAVSEVLNELLLWLPNLVVAVVILVIGGLAANALASLVRGATKEADLGNPALFATITKAAVWAFAIIIAVNQLGIAQTFVNTLFIGVVAALSLALGLAFGLGGRETASEVVQTWHSQAKGAGKKVEKAAQHAKKQANSAGAEIARSSEGGSS